MKPLLQLTLAAALLAATSALAPTGVTTATRPPSPVAAASLATKTVTGKPVTAPAAVRRACGKKAPKPARASAPERTRTASCR